MSRGALGTQRRQQPEDWPGLPDVALDPGQATGDSFAELADDGTVGPSPREHLEALRAKVLRVRTALAHMRYG